MELKVDWDLIRIVVNTEIYADSTNQEIIEVVRAKYSQEKYPQLKAEEIYDYIWSVRVKILQEKLELYHLLNHDLSSVGDYDENVGGSEYRIYKDLPDDRLWKMMIDDGLGRLARVKPELEAVLVLKYIEQKAWNEIQSEIECKSCATVYNRLRRGLIELAKIIEEGRDYGVQSG